MQQQQQQQQEEYMRQQMMMAEQERQRQEWMQVGPDSSQYHPHQVSGWETDPAGSMVNRCSNNR